MENVLYGDNQFSCFNAKAMHVSDSIIQHTAAKYIEKIYFIHSSLKRFGKYPITQNVIYFNHTFTIVLPVRDIYFYIFNHCPIFGELHTLGEHPLFTNFNTTVIKPSIEQIDKCTDITIYEVEKVKQGEKETNLVWKFGWKLGINH